MKIMFCHDTSDVAQRDLDRCLEMFSEKKPEVILLTVAEGPADASMENEEIYDRVKKDVHDKNHKIAEGIAAKGFDVDAIIANGDPRNMIVETVKAKSPDIVVLGRRGAGGVKEMLLGSVAAFVIRHVETAVLVMQHGD